MHAPMHSSITHSCIHSFMNSLIIFSFIQSSFVHLSVHSFMAAFHSFGAFMSVNLAFVRSFRLSFIPPPVPSFMHSCTHSWIRSLHMHVRNGWEKMDGRPWMGNIIRPQMRVHEWGGRETSDWTAQHTTAKAYVFYPLWIHGHKKRKTKTH